jgi:hypothetical protein
MRCNLNTHPGPLKIKHGNRIYNACFISGLACGHVQAFLHLAEMTYLTSPKYLDFLTLTRHLNKLLVICSVWPDNFKNLILLSYALLNARITSWQRAFLKDVITGQVIKRLYVFY